MSLPPDDRGFTLGDGVFETVLADNGRLVALDRHLARFARSAARLGLPAPDPGRAAAAASEALRRAGLTTLRAAVRLNWTAGSGGRGLDRPEPLRPLLLATAAPAPAPSAPARLHLSSVRRNETSPASRAKTLGYLDNILARREARAHGADEALMLNTRGEVAGGAAANLFWIRDGRLFTPALDCGVLDGVVRGQVLACAASLGVEAREAAAAPDALTGAEALFLTNSLIGLRPAAFQSVPAAPHPLTTALSEAVAALRSSCR